MESAALFTFLFKLRSLFISGQMNKRALAKDLQKRKAKRAQQWYVRALYMEMDGNCIFCNILSQ